MNEYVQIEYDLQVCAGWQNLAAFRRGQKWPENFCQTRIYNFRDKWVVFARNRKFANLTQ